MLHEPTLKPSFALEDSLDDKYRADELLNAPLRVENRPAFSNFWSAHRLRLWLSFQNRLYRLVGWLSLIGAGGWLVVEQPGIWATLAAFVLSLVLVNSSARPIDQRSRLIELFSIVVGISSTDYLAWRVSVINWACWYVALPLFGAELFGILHVLGLQYTLWPRPALEFDSNSSTGNQKAQLLPIFIFIPTVNEDLAIIEATIEGARTAREAYLAVYPGATVRVVVCNDRRAAGLNDWELVERLASRQEVECVTRPLKGGAKAGNLENARQQLGAVGQSLVVIFDADQIARPDFLLKTVPAFANEDQLGWVQTGQYYRNLANPVARWAHDQQALFYQVLCAGKASLNAAFICGTNVVIRAAALDEIGGLPQDSVTEDFAASIQLHPRWRSIFVEGVLATGLGPPDLKSYFSQQSRWATGTLGVIRTHWRAIFLPLFDVQAKPPLKVEQRVQYALACTHYLCGVRDLVYVVAPLVYLFTGTAAVRGSDLAAFGVHFLPYWLASQVAFWYVSWNKSGWRGIVLSFGSYPVLLVSLVSLLLGRRAIFTVTAKQRSTTSIAGKGRQLSHLVPHVLTLLACGAGLIFALGNPATFNSTATQLAPLVISLLWLSYTMIMLVAMLWLGLVLDRDRATKSQPSLCTTSLTPPLDPPKAWLKKALPLTLGLVGLASIGLSMRLVSVEGREPAVFRPDGDSQHLQLGLSLSTPVLKAGQIQLESQLALPFTIVGRTQDINDEFDRDWANSLATSGKRPWITLLFATGQPSVTPLDVSLPAIANGLHDQPLRQWARSVRRYGKPVYLSVLPHLDRNWSLSSAVTNGGIPQDGPRAWQHLRDIFRQEGALNVAWVWSPADPAHDLSYAPPITSIDLVLISLISYPDTEWADPVATLAAVRRRYPATPLFLEVSAAGPTSRKAAWLEQAAAAAGTTPGVQALLYHEGGPTTRFNESTAYDDWSLASDPSIPKSLRQVILSQPRYSPNGPGAREVWLSLSKNSSIRSGEKPE